MTTKIAIIGSGNIGTDLMIKVLRKSNTLEMAALVGIDRDSDGLRRAAGLGVAATSEGVDGLRRLDVYNEVGIVFDATSAGAHKANYEKIRADGKIMIDLTPAALGPFVIPAVNLDDHLEADNLNMVTCGGQATIPMVAAVASVASVTYAEIVACIASKSAGPGTRANIDEFTETTSQAIVSVGGAKSGKAIIVLNPAEPPLIMRDTVYCLVRTDDRDAITAAVSAMVEKVQTYVPGYRLKQAIQFERIGDNAPIRIPGVEDAATGLKVTIFLEVEGAGHYLPPYAGNLDIMTSAAFQTAERLVSKRKRKVAQ
jgi:acetaldehyde dehydrogenase